MLSCRSECQQRLAMPAPIGGGSGSGFAVDSADRAGPACSARQASRILPGEAFQSKAFFWD